MICLSASTTLPFWGSKNRRDEVSRRKSKLILILWQCAELACSKGKLSNLSSYFVNTLGCSPLELQHIFQVRFLYPSNMSLILNLWGRICGGRTRRRGGNAVPMKCCWLQQFFSSSNYSFYICFSEEPRKKRKFGLLQKQQQQKILDVKLCGPVVDSENRFKEDYRSKRKIPQGMAAEVSHSCIYYVRSKWNSF